MGELLIIIIVIGFIYNVFFEKQEKTDIGEVYDRLKQIELEKQKKVDISEALDRLKQIDFDEEDNKKTKNKTLTSKKTKNFISSKNKKLSSNDYNDKEEYISTTTLGKQISIPQKIIIENFIDQGLIKRINSKLQITEKGKELGGIYGMYGPWIVWPKKLLKNHTFIKSIKEHKNNIYVNTSPINSSLRDKIHYLGEYHPYHNGHNPQFDNFSSNILDFKRNNKSTIEYFFNRLKNIDFDNTEVITIVPSHSTNSSMSSVTILAQKLAKHNGWLDATHCVKRTKTIQKLATGGDRSISTHLNSLQIIDSHLLDGKNVLVLDDVTTSGHSLEAVMQLIRRENIKSVWAYALARTS